MASNMKLEKVRQALLPKARAAQQVLASDAGKILMDALEREFLFGDLMGATPERTAFNLGAREVVVYLRQLRDFDPQDRSGE